MRHGLYYQILQNLLHLGHAKRRYPGMNDIHRWVQSILLYAGILFSNVGSQYF